MLNSFKGSGLLAAGLVLVLLAGIVIPTLITRAGAVVPERAEAADAAETAAPESEEDSFRTPQIRQISSDVTWLLDAVVHTPEVQEDVLPVDVFPPQLPQLTQAKQERLAALAEEEAARAEQARLAAAAAVTSAPAAAAAPEAEPSAAPVSGSGLPDDLVLLDTFYATAYYLTGLTATGTYTTENRTLAVNPDIIPYGTHVWIFLDDGTFVGDYYAEDTGGNMMKHPYVVDIYMGNDYDKCVEWGSRHVSIYVRSGE